MPKTYEPIATNTLGSAATFLTFSSIAGTYTDLVVVFNGSLSSGSTDYFCLQFNGDTGSNYSYTGLYGTGSAAGSLRGTSTAYNYTGLYFESGSFQNVNQIVNIQNYSNSTTHKTTLARGNNAGLQLGAYVGLWRNTAAITSVKCFTLSGANFATGSTFTLYGIKSA
jgi:hypothetical protein